MDNFKTSRLSDGFPDCQVFTEVVFLPNEVKAESGDDFEVMPLAIMHNENSSEALLPINLPDLREENTMYNFSEFNESNCDNRQDGVPTEEQWAQWMREYSWLLHEKSDGIFGYCLYCDSNICIRKAYTIAKHDASVNHNERKDNYLIFKRSQEDALRSFPIVNVKDEFGNSPSDADAARFKRQSEAELLSNFNWNSWMQTHDWLERFGTEGFTGYCKYCEHTLNAEFRYLRHRHEESVAHKEACRRAQNEEEGMEMSNNDFRQDENAVYDHEHHDVFQMVPNIESERHCTVCNVQLNVSSIRKHLKTKLHNANLRQNSSSKRATIANVNNEEQLPIKQENDIWEAYQELHPWLVADPIDPKIAYCKYCRKRFMYGTSLSKRIQHEKSFRHKASEEQYKMVQTISDDDTDGSTDQEDNDNGNELSADEGANDGNEEWEPTSKTSKNQRALRGSNAWFKETPWARRIPSMPDYIFCTYCNVRLSIRSLSRWKHQRSARHIAGHGEEPWGRRPRQNSQISKNGDENKDIYFDWAVRCPETGMINCKLCNVNLGPTTSLLKHEQCLRHSELSKNEQVHDSSGSPNASQLADDTNDRSEIHTADSNDPTAHSLAKEAETIQERNLKWKKKFPWSVFNKKSNPNYVFCKYCEAFIFATRQSSLLKHSKTIKHIRFRAEKRKKGQTAKPLEDNANTNAEMAEDSSHVELSNDASETSWLPHDSNCKSYGNGKNYNACTRVDGSFKESQEKSEKHRQAKETFKHTEHQQGRNNITDEADGAMEIDDDCDQLSASSAAPLEPIEVKNAVGEVNNSSTKAPSPSKRNIENDMPSMKGLNPSQRELLRLIFHINEKNEPPNLESSTSERILSSSLSLATWLANLMPQSNSSHQHSFTESSSLPGNERNTFDLFFTHVSEIFKSLPPDLASEGKIKVMGVLHGLEVRALQRNKTTAEKMFAQNPFESPSTTTNGGDTE